MHKIGAHRASTLITSLLLEGFVGRDANVVSVVVQSMDVENDVTTLGLLIVSDCLCQHHLCLTHQKSSSASVPLSSLS